jgi:hypothetical protein
MLRTRSRPDSRCCERRSVRTLAPKMKAHPMPILRRVLSVLYLAVGLGFALATPSAAGPWHQQGRDFGAPSSVVSLHGGRGGFGLARGGRRAMMIRDYYAFRGQDVREMRRAQRQAQRPQCRAEARAAGLAGPMNRDARRSFVQACVRSRVT